MSEHTPGPWEQDPTGDVGWWLIGTAEKPVAQVVIYDSACGLTVKEARTNARLIREAPALLAVCRAVLYEWSSLTHEQQKAVSLAGAAAIERVDGRAAKALKVSR